MGWAVLVLLAFGAVAAVVAVGAGQPGASAAVGAGVDGQLVHRCSLSGRAVRAAVVGSPYCLLRLSSPESLSGM
jgi:hypothetical protein